MKVFLPANLDNAPGVLLRASSGVLDRVEVCGAEARVGTSHHNLQVAGYAPILVASVEGGVEIQPLWGRLQTANTLFWGIFGGVSTLVSVCCLLAQMVSGKGVPFADVAAFVAVALLSMGVAVPWLVTKAQTRRARRDWDALVVAVRSPGRLSGQD